MALADYAEFHGIKALNAIDALSIAAANSLLKEMQLLLDDGVDINAMAAYSKATTLCNASRLGMTRSVAFLIEEGADVNCPGEVGTTPLMFACSLGGKKGLQVAQQLIAAGADVNYAIDGEVTALFSVTQKSSPEIAQMLLDHGAKVDGAEDASQTALMLAARSDDVPTIKVLLAAGAAPSRACKLPWAENRTALGLAELEKCRKAAAYLKGLDGK